MIRVGVHLVATRVDGCGPDERGRCIHEIHANTLIRNYEHDGEIYSTSDDPWLNWEKDASWSQDWWAGELIPNDLQWAVPQHGLTRRPASGDTP